MKYLLSLIMLAFIAGPTFAQVQEAEKAMSAGTHNSYAVTLKGVPTKEIQKMFIGKLKDAKAKKPKADRKTGFIFGDDARLGTISTNTVDVYGIVDEQDDQTQVTVWFDLGGAYLSSEQHPEQSAAGKAWLMELEREVKIRAVEIEVEQEEDNLKALEKELEKLAKAQAGLEKNIKDYEEKIKAAEQEIETKVQEQEAKRTEIETQQKLVEKTKQKMQEID